ncbi:MAG: DMT family transporter [Chryseolinea sp.]
MQQDTARSEKIFLVGMILSMTCWGISWTSGKILSSYSGPIIISFLRFAFTFLSLLFILPILKSKLTIAKAGLLDLVCAAIMISIYTFLFFRGLITGKPGAGGVLVTILNPIISYFIMLVMNRRRPTRNEVIGLALGISAGVILLKLLTDASDIFRAGNLYFLFASVSWAILSVFTSRSSRYGEPVTFSFYMYGISTLIMLFFTDWNTVLTTLQSGDGIFWFNLFFSATVTTAIATTFYFVATAKIGASRASSFIFLVPFSASLGSWFFFNEIPQVNTIIGGVLGIGAVLILNKK